MRSREEALRSLLQSTYYALQHEQPLTARTYEILRQKQEDFAIAPPIDAPDWIDRIVAALLANWAELCWLEARGQSRQVRSRLEAILQTLLHSVPTMAAYPLTDHSLETPWAMLCQSGGLLCLGMAIAAGLWFGGQTLQSRWAHWAPPPAPSVAVGGQEGESSTALTGTPGASTPSSSATPLPNALGIEANLWQQLQRSYAQAQSVPWETLTPDQQDALTATLTTRLQTLPAPTRAQLGQYTEQTLRPPTGCQRSAQALYDQADLALYRLFPELLGVNIAQTGFDQVWYALLVGQQQTACG